MKMPRGFRFARLNWIWILLALSSPVFAQPQPGDVWREYHMAPASTGFFRMGGIFGGQENLEVNYPFSPSFTNTTPHTLDLTGAVKAELTIGYNQSHSGAPLLYVSMNNNPYQRLNLPASIPNRGYFFHVYPTVTIPLAQLNETSNLIRFTSQKKIDDGAAYVAGYDQSLIYEIILRIYYDRTVKGGPSGTITQPTNNAVLDASAGKRPTVAATATTTAGTISRVDFIGNYQDYDRTGDNQTRLWHYRWKHFNRDTFLTFIDRIASDTTAPFSGTWDMTWLPDQTEPMQLSAFVTDSNGLMTFLPPVTGVTMSRPDRSVELARPYNTPPAYNTASSKLLQSNFNIGGNLRTATAAKLVYQYWLSSGNDDMGFVLNGGHHHTFRPDEFFPLSLLRPGVNTIDPDQGGHHGMEILWPGVGVYVSYNPSAAPALIEQPADLAVLPGSAARFVARLAGVPEPTYRWQVSTNQGVTWSDVTGGTAAALEVPATTTAMDRSLYRVIATNASGSVTSRHALLRVSSILPSFQEVSGRIVIEAESFDTQDFYNDGYGWMIVTDKNLPSNGLVIWNYFENNTKSTWQTAATVNYRFRAPEAGNYIAWFRVRNKEADKNHSLIIGYDGVQDIPLYPVKGSTAWQWVSLPAQPIAKGERVLNVMRRSDGLIVDKIILTRDAAYNPNTAGGAGAAESPRDIVQDGAPRITFPTAATVVTAGESLTLTGTGENLVWSVSGVLTAGGTGTSLVITLPAFPPDGSVLNISLAGTGGADSLSLPVVIPPRAYLEADGQVVMEAEDFFENNLRSDNQRWAFTTEQTGFVGSGYMTTSDIANTAQTWEAGAQLTYDVVFQNPGTYYLWMRARQSGGAGNSAWFGLRSGTPPVGFFDNATAAGWYWLRDEVVVIPSAGRHTLALVNREDGYSVDRILLTTDASYSPVGINSGNGPAKSAREGDVLTLSYAAWSVGKTWAVPSDAAFSADPDGDGQANGFEFFSGTDPLAANPSSLEPAVEAGASGHVFVWRVPVAPNVLANLAVRSTNDLSTWPAPVVVHPSAGALPAGITASLTGSILEIRIEAGAGTFHRLEAGVP